MSRSDSTGISAARDNIMKWAQRPEWMERFEAIIDAHTAPALKEFEFKSLQEMIEETGDDSLIDTIISNAFEDLLSGGGLKDEHEDIVSEYLRRRGYRESAPARRYLQALSESIISIYEVLESVPDSHLVLRDRVKGGEPIRVTERTGSRQLVTWDRIACRIVPRLQEFVISGTPLAFDPEVADDLEARMIAAHQDADGEFRDSIPGASEADRRLIVEYMVSRVFASILTSTWLCQVLEDIEGPLPDLKNADGDDLVFIEIRWPLAGEARAIEAKLDSAQSHGFQREETEKAPTWRWSGKPQIAVDGETRVVTYDPNPPDPDIDSVSLGMLWIEGTDLVLQTNSEGRAARGRARIEEVLADAIAPATEKLTSLDELPEVLGRMGGGLPDDMGGQIPPEAEIEYKARYYRKWLDEPIPLLDGKSPREAASTPDCRHDLLALLKGLENLEERWARNRGVPAPDYQWLWQELNIPRDEATR